MTQIWNTMKWIKLKTSPQLNLIKLLLKLRHQVLIKLHTLLLCTRFKLDNAWKINGRKQSIESVFVKMQRVY